MAGIWREPQSVRRALAIRERLSRELAFREIPVPYQEELEIEHGVLGYRSIRHSLKFARDLITDADPSTIFMIGGTCGSEIGPISFLNQKYDGDMSVLWFDAHGDLNTPETSPSGHFHGMPLRLLLGEGPEEIRSLAFSCLSPTQIILVGARDLDPAERRYIKANGVAHMGPRDLSVVGPLIATTRRMGHRNLYIHVDLDVLEPGDFPHLLMPSPGGILFENLLVLLTELRENFSVVGSSIVEYVPTDGGDLEGIEKLKSVLRT